MKREFAALEIDALVKEWQVLLNGRIDQVYQPESKEVILQVRKSGGEKTLLRIAPPVAHLLSSKPSMPPQIQGFCGFLRNHIANVRIFSILRVPGERVVRIDVTKGAGLRVYMELYGKGNIVVCDDQDVIIGVLDVQERAGVRIAPREVYRMAAGKELATITRGDIAALLDGRRSVQEALASGLGIGNLYTKEICLRAKIDPAAKRGDVDALFEAFGQLIREPIDARVVWRDNEIVDVTPWPLMVYEGLRQEAKPSYDAAIEALLGSVAPAAKPINKKAEALKQSLAKQEAARTTLLQKAEDERRKGEYIYENYPQVKAVLDEANEARAESWDALKRKLGARLKNVDPATGEVVVEV